MTHWQMFWTCIVLLIAVLAIPGAVVGCIVAGQWWRGHQRRRSIQRDAAKLRHPAGKGRS